MMLVFCLLSVIISCMAQEESVSINRPRTRMQQPRLQINTDQVRCFCNLPICVSTGYMCKSSSGGCFSDFLDPSTGSAYTGRHGCVEYLTESLRHLCLAEKDGQVPNRDKKHPRSLLVCCSTDLCNHADNPSTKNLLNNSMDEESDSKLQHQGQEAFLYSNSEVWFRAATIAVPFCGAVILFALIALAVKLLRKENQMALHHKLGPAMYVVPTDQKHDRWSGQPYNPCSVKKPIYSQAHPSAFGVSEDDLFQRQFHMPLLAAHEGSREFSMVNSPPSAANESKNDANAKLNLMQCDSNCSKSIILDIGKSTPDLSLAANINLNNEDKFCKEKSLLS